MKKQNQVFFIITIFFILTMLMTSISYADPITDPNSYNPGAVADSDIAPIASKGGIILSVISTIGIVVGVLTLIILGIKYMTGSVEEKADYKKTMIPYLIGMFMILGISAILKAVAGSIENINF